MAEGSQTRQFILQPVTPGDIPENLIAKVRLARKVIQDAIVLPKACILTDEVMKNFWVMKLVNDTLAVKVPVIPGLTEGNNVQITEPVFSDSDLFLSSGNYGLGDSVRVVVIKK